MDQNKPSKSITWIVATIWANIIIVSIIFAVIISIISFLLVSNGAGILLDTLYLKGNISEWIPYLLVLISEFFGIWLGIRTVLKRSSVKHEDHITISIITGLVAPIIAIITIPIVRIISLFILPYHFSGILYFFANCLRFSFIWIPKSYYNFTFTFSQILQLLFSAAYIGLITYYWLKKLNH